MSGLQFAGEQRAGYFYAALSGDFTLDSAKAVFRGVRMRASESLQELLSWLGV